MAALARGRRVVASAEPDHRAGGRQDCEAGEVPAIRLRRSGRPRRPARRRGMSWPMAMKATRARSVIACSWSRTHTGCSPDWHTRATRSAWNADTCTYDLSTRGAGESDAAVAEATSAGHLGRNLHGTTSCFEVMVVEGAGSYVAGEETALLHALEGRRGAVRPDRRTRPRRDCSGHLTAVNNVETLLSVPWIVDRGGEAFASFGRAPETGTKLVCLNEAFAAPRRLRGRAGHAHPEDHRRARRRAARQPATAFVSRWAGRSVAFSPPRRWMCRCSKVPCCVRGGPGSCEPHRDR